MCGIVGIAGLNDSSMIKKMAKEISYRGPNDSGFFSDKNIELGHRRLSIIDISKRGKQPIFNENKDICIVFNGEIYNFLELKEDLIKKGHKFESNTDTEVIVHAYEEYPNFVERLNGIFAFAIWDSKKKTLILARDRIGIKPLYYFIQDNVLYFASEIKSLLLAKEDKKIDREGVDLYFRWSHFPLESTVIEGIKRLMPGHTLSYKNKSVKIERYWNLDFNESDNKDEKYWINSFQKTFQSAVKSQLMADVPLGIFLSGGLDSSSIAAMASINNRVKTFSVGFDSDDVQDELVPARKVAEHLGTEHKELIVRDDVPKHLKDIIYYLDEPVANLAAIPMFFMAKEAGKHVRVVLTGSGSDELFAGYRHYKLIKYAKYGMPLIKPVSPAFKMFEKLKINNNKKRYFDFAREYSKRSNDNKKLFELIRLGGKEENKVPIKEIFDNKWNITNKLTGVDIKFLLPENYLLIEDRMGMAHALEARVPFLDNNMVSLSERMPANLKLRGFTGKYIVRKSMAPFLPKEIIKRKKYGFTAPLGLWWKDFFSSEMKNMLPDIKNDKVYDYDETVKLIELADKGDKDSINKLWKRFNLQLWMDQFYHK